MSRRKKSRRQRTVKRSSHRTSTRNRSRNLIWGFAAITVALLVGVLLIARPWAPTPAEVESRQTSTQPIGAVLVYTAPTSTEAGARLPSEVREEFRRLGRQETSLTLVRVEEDGSIRQSSIDLTPRTGGHVLKVDARADQAMDTIINDIEAAMAEPTGEGATSRTLYTGLLRASIPLDVPLFLVGSLDLADPIDFRKLAFGVAPDRIVEVLTEAGQLPNFDGSSVTFVLVPSAGAQAQMRTAERNYTKEVWKNILLKGAQARDVTFIESLDAPTRATTPTPIVPLPDLPGTPIKPEVDPEKPSETVCEVPTTTYFEYGSATLTDPSVTADALRTCITKAIQANAHVMIDAWTSYEGLLDGAGRPVGNPQTDIDLSQNRADAIQEVLVDYLDVPAANIVHVKGHGSEDQLDPDPRSSANRVTIVRYSA